MLGETATGYNNPYRQQTTSPYKPYISAIRKKNEEKTKPPIRFVEIAKGVQRTSRGPRNKPNTMRVSTNITVKWLSEKIYFVLSQIITTLFTTRKKKENGNKKQTKLSMFFSRLDKWDGFFLLLFIYCVLFRSYVFWNRKWENVPWSIIHIIYRENGVRVCLCMCVRVCVCNVGSGRVRVGKICVIARALGDRRGRSHRTCVSVHFTYYIAYLKYRSETKEDRRSAKKKERKKMRCR